MKPTKDVTVSTYLSCIGDGGRIWLNILGRLVNQAWFLVKVSVALVALCAVMGPLLAVRLGLRELALLVKRRTASRRARELALLVKRRTASRRAP